jgi:hypothetical protein
VTADEHGSEAGLPQVAAGVGLQRIADRRSVVRAVIEVGRQLDPGCSVRNRLTPRASRPAPICATCAWLPVRNDSGGGHPLQDPARKTRSGLTTRHCISTA